MMSFGRISRVHLPHSTSPICTGYTRSQYSSNYAKPWTEFASSHLLMKVDESRVRLHREKLQCLALQHHCSCRGILVGVYAGIFTNTVPFRIIRPSRVTPDFFWPRINFFLDLSEFLRFFKISKTSRGGRIIHFPTTYTELTFTSSLATLLADTSDTPWPSTCIFKFSSPFVSFCREGSMVTASAASINIMRSVTWL